MHERKDVNRIAYDHVDGEMRKSSDGMCASDILDTSERRETLRSVDHILRSLPHFGEELEPETRHALVIVIGRLLELCFGFRLDQEPRGHRALSLDSRRSNTCSAGLPSDCPDLTRSARRAISASHSAARLASDSRRDRIDDDAALVIGKLGRQSNDLPNGSARHAVIFIVRGPRVEPRCGRNTWRHEGAKDASFQLFEWRRRESNRPRRQRLASRIVAKRRGRRRGRRSDQVSADAVTAP
jgi:hypothetical protein